jgi:uncharacterized membrane protein
VNRPEARASIPLRSILFVLGVMLVIALAVKLPCLTSKEVQRGATFRPCYSDIVPLFTIRHLNQGKFPYLQTPVEYPVLTGVYMGTLARVSSTPGTFFLLNAIGLAAAALITAGLLYHLRGSRALYFAAATSIIWYAFLNWDLLAVALATGAIVAYLSRRPVLAGVLIGLGISTKLYPGLLLIPFVVDAARTRDRRQSVEILGATVLSWLVVNAPFGNWSLFFRFNSSRTAEFNSLYFVACHRLLGQLRCRNVSVINGLSVALFLAGAVIVWRAKTRRFPEVPRWTFTLALILLFLLTTKIYSPQYALWVLPWFALVLPDVRLWAAFLATDAAVYFTEFAWLRRYAGLAGWPVWAVELAIVLRAAVIVACLIAWIRRPGTDGHIESALGSTEDRPPAPELETDGDRLSGLG